MAERTGQGYAVYRDGTGELLATGLRRDIAERLVAELNEKLADDSIAEDD